MYIGDVNLDITCLPDGSEDFLKDKNFYTDYSYDILNTLFEDERKRIQISGENHQNIRDYLIGVMKTFVKTKKYGLGTLHLAALFLDVYMDSYILSIIPEHQKFSALVTLLLAAKIEENDENVPSIKDLLRIVDLSDELGVDINKKQNYEAEELTKAYKSFLKLYCTMEFMIFECLEFNAIRPTPITFLTIFKKIAATEIDIRDVLTCLDIQTVDDLKVYVNHILKMLSEVLLNDISFHKYMPSKVAAAMIATTRKLLNFKTNWTLQLEFLTHASFDEIEPIVMIFLEKISITNEHNSSVEDSGFLSADSSSPITPPISECCEDISQSSKRLKTSDEGS